MGLHMYLESLQKLPSTVRPAFSNHVFVIAFVFMLEQCLRATDFQHEVFGTGAEQLACGMLGEMYIFQQNS
jgi:hypothetical protein